MRIDAHQHFWHYDPVKYDWINDDMRVIRRDFLPSDLQPVLEQNEIDGCVAVQADQTEDETSFLLDLAGENDFIKGVVGWVDLRRDDVNERLGFFKQNLAFKGVRHVLQAEPEGFMTDKRFLEGVKAVGSQGLTYDILTVEHQLPEVVRLLQQLPEMRLVIDHISKPGIKQGSFDNWARQMRILSEYEHLHVKLSGMVTEADWRQWREGDFTRYIDFCLEYFGPSRLMFGSDWPVCLVAAEYTKVIELVTSHISQLSEPEQADIMGNTAFRFYHLR